ncbi:MAG TPA: dihydrolipoamide acetyltransferase family protein [Solirubrobacterales bacterium]|jgi:pyruvate dehydrogenase E2 component (dihydrolipoamide acetyltransferase)|nr:dihydrolipoamide acetyltransferase family protein [Solirubrobacterales bacterium]
MSDIVMPRLSDSMEEGTILKWLKQVGDEIAVGDELVEIETDKANMAYEADVAGTLTEILAEEGETLPIGSTIARVGNGEAVERSAPPLRHQQKEPVEPPDSSDGGGRPKASPLAKRIAKERGLDLSQLQGSGPGGRVVKADVERAASSTGGAGEGPRIDAVRPPAGPSPVTGPVAEAVSPETAKGQTTYRDLSKLQSTIARRMAESKATAPHFYLKAEVDMSRAVEARGRIKASAGEGEVVPSFNDMVVKACALALREFPRANGAYRDGRFELYSRVNVGIAVAGQDALVVPTVFDADRKGLRQIASESRGLAQRVRDGQITPPELSGATFTVSNLGMYGIDSFSAVINPPQAAILAVGAIRERPAVRSGELVAAHLMSVTLACDHRILYGAEGAQFLARIRALLEEPVSLAL